MLRSQHPSRNIALKGVPVRRVQPCGCSQPRRCSAPGPPPLPPPPERGQGASVEGGPSVAGWRKCTPDSEAPLILAEIGVAIGASLLDGREGALGICIRRT